MKFTGQGTFLLKVRRADEVASFNNVGITTDYRFDLSQSYPRHDILLFKYGKELEAVWYMDGVYLPPHNIYFEAIKYEFFEVYKFFLEYGHTHGYGHLHPNSRLLGMYLLELTKVFINQFSVNNVQNHFFRFY